MRPLPHKTRWIFFGVAVVLFFVIAPLTVFYSLGYRFGNNETGIHETGGIFVHPWIVGGNFLLNGEEIGGTTIFDRSEFIQGLTPGTYTIEMQRDGYSTWKKEIPVVKEHVTEVSPFIISLEPAIEEITKTITDETTGKKKTNPNYTEVAALWKTAPPVEETPIVEDLRESYIEHRRVGLWRNGDAIYAGWLGETNVIPFFFCIDLNVCRTVIPVLSNVTSSEHFDFYPGRNDIMLINLTDGIYAIELDTRGTQNRALLYSGLDLDFKVLNSEKLYIKKGDHYYVLGV